MKRVLSIVLALVIAFGTTAYASANALQARVSGAITTVSAGSASGAASASISPQGHTFPSAQVGYGVQAVQMFTVTNTGAVRLYAAGWGRNYFEIIELDDFFGNRYIEPGESFRFNVRPRLGLNTGGYECEVQFYFTPAASYEDLRHILDTVPNIHDYVAEFLSITRTEVDAWGDNEWDDFWNGRGAEWDGSLRYLADYEDWMLNHRVIVSAEVAFTVTSSEDTLVTPAPLMRTPQPSEATTISAGGTHTAGLRADGTVVATRVYYVSEPSLIHSGDLGQSDVSDWRGIVAVAAGGFHTVGLRADGTVVATRATDALHDLGQSDVNDWRDVVAISAGFDHTLGLKSDGTVLLAGDDGNGMRLDILGWRDIVAISAGGHFTVGLRSDGSVVAVGAHTHPTPPSEVFDWSDIIAVSAGNLDVVGLRSDGTAVGAGSNANSELNVSGWRDIVMVSISAAGSHTVGLRSDGTVVAVGWNANGQLDVTGWYDIVAVSAGGMHTVGLRADGTVVTAGDISNGQGEVSSWRDIRVTTPEGTNLNPRTGR